MQAKANEFKHRQFYDYMHDRRKKKFFVGQTSKTSLCHPGKTCPVRWENSEGRKALTMHAGGADCTPYTRAGDRLGFAHPALIPYSYFHNEQASDVMDMKHVEESSEAWAAELEEDNIVIYIVCGDERIGLMVYRPRFYGGAFSRRTFVWVGLSTGDVTAEFLRFFERRPMLEADVYARMDTEANIQRTRALAHFTQRARRKSPGRQLPSHLKRQWCRC